MKEHEEAAISGTTENRPGFQQMLSEVAKIRPRVLIIWKTDRLGRDKDETGERLGFPQARPHPTCRI